MCLFMNLAFEKLITLEISSLEFFVSSHRNVGIGSPIEFRVLFICDFM